MSARLTARHVCKYEGPQSNEKLLNGMDFIQYMVWVKSGLSWAEFIDIPLPKLNKYSTGVKDELEPTGTFVDSEDGDGWIFNLGKPYNVEQTGEEISSFHCRYPTTADGIIPPGRQKNFKTTRAVIAYTFSKITDNAIGIIYQMAASDFLTVVDHLLQLKADAFGVSLDEDDEDF